MLVSIAVLILPAHEAEATKKWGDWPAWGDQGDGTYRNPVIPADYSDIDCIRVGSDYYAISSTMQFSPGMVILHSKDLVNWSIIGHAVNDLNQIGPELNWDKMNRYSRGIWAGSIRYHENKFWVFFGTPDEGYFITTATNPAGPWEPLHPLFREAGWDDCSALWDDDEHAYFVRTRFAENDVHVYKTYIFKMSPDGRTIDRDSAVLVNEASGRKANKLLKVTGWYYLIYSEQVEGKGRYVSAKRSKNIMGPYTEVKQLSHADRDAYQPNQGGSANVPVTPEIGVRVNSPGFDLGPETNETVVKAAVAALKKFLVNWAQRNIELIDQYQPDILWFDNGVDNRVFDSIKLWIAAYYYNRALERKKDVSLSTKKAAYAPDGDNVRAVGSILDFEKISARSPAGIRTGVWEVDDPIGAHWGYAEGMRVKLVDHVDGMLSSLVPPQGVENRTYD